MLLQLKLLQIDIAKASLYKCKKIRKTIAEIKINTRVHLSTKNRFLLSRFFSHLE